MLTLLFATLCVLQTPVQAKDSVGEVRVSLAVFNQPLKKVLRTVEAQTGLKFFYLTRQVDVQQKVSVQRADAPLADVLGDVFRHTGITFQFAGRQIILKKENTTAPAEMSPATPNLGETTIPPDVPAVGGKHATPPEFSVSGKVTGDNGESIPGVNVLLKGTTTGTTTDGEGRYALNVPDGQSRGTLVFSYIGYVNEEVAINGRTVVDLVMVPDVKSLSEVVVVGYGLMKKRDVIGSVSSVSGKDLNVSRSPRIEQALQGKVSGVQVTSSSGVPGADVRVLVRGISTISASAGPLWVVDGIPVTDIGNLNPNDVSSIEVLKDAGATSIYGSRGSNGVILITTKSAGKNERNFSVGVSSGVSTLTKTPEQMGIANTSEYFGIVDAARANAGFGPGVPDDIMAFNMSNVRGPFTRITREEAENTNIRFDELYRRASYTDVNLSNASGFEKGSLFVSFNYRHDKGIEHNNGLKRYSVRLNADTEPVGNLKVGTKFNVSYTQNDLSTGYFNSMTNNRLPWFPFYNATDPTGYWNPLKNISPITYSQDNRVNRSNEYRLLGGVFAQYNLPFLKGLFVRSEFNTDLKFSAYKDWSSEAISERGSYAYESQSRLTNLLYNAYLGYNQSFGNHTFTLTAGAERQRINQYNTTVAGTNLTSSFPEYGTNPQLGNGTFSGIAFERYLGAYFGRAGYKFKDRYLLETSFRRDGSSAFTKQYRYGNFASLAAGWIISEEPFFKNINAVKFLKLRGSVGQTGNQEIPSGIAQPIWSAGAGNWGGADNSGMSGQRQTNIINEKATWETTTSYDAGLDFGLLDNRLNGSVAYYNRDVSGLLLELSLPFSAGVESNIWSNVGRMTNRGFEFDLRSVNVVAGSFRWSSGLNLTTSRNKVARLSEELDLNNSGILFRPDALAPDISTLTKTGLPVGQYYLAEFAYVDPERGINMIYELDQEHFKETGQTRRTGKVVPASLNNLKNNRFILDKTGIPTFFGSFSNAFEYKGFDLDVLFTYSGGNYLYNLARRTGHRIDRGNNNVYAEAYDKSWKQPGDQAELPQLMWAAAYKYDDEGNPSTTFNDFKDDYALHSKYLEKAGYIRLRNVTLGYSLPGSISERLRISRLRLYVSASNLFTWTKFTGWDPEAVRIDNTQKGTNLAPGFVGNTIPQLKTYTMGLSLTF